MLVRSSVGRALVALGFLFTASLLAAADKQVKHGTTRTTRPEISVTSVPRLLRIDPDTPPETVIIAVGAVTTLDFGDEKPLSFISGLREQLGVEQSSARFPGNLIHLRPSLELADKTTNVTVETDHGRTSFFIKTIFNPNGAKPGTFHSEVRITTAGHVAHMKMLNDRISSLDKELQELKAANLKKIAEMERIHDRDVVQEYERGLKAVLERLSVLPVVGQKKRHPPQNVGDFVITPVATTLDGSTRVVLIDVENKASVTRTFNVAAFEKDGQVVMQPEVRDLLPKQRVRVAMLVRRAPGTTIAAKADARPPAPGK